MTIKPPRLWTMVCLVACLGAPALAAEPAQPSDSLLGLAAQLEKTPANIVANVNATPITLGMIAQRLREFPPNMKTLDARSLFNLALNDLLQQRAAVLKAKELGLDKDPAVKQRIANATDQELIAALIARQAPAEITEQAIRDRYKQNIEGKPGPEEVKLRVIITPTREEAEDALRRISNGMEFAEAASTYSHDSSKAVGGEVGYVQRRQLGAETGAVAFALSPGQTTAYPVQSKGLWFVLRVEGRRQRAAPTLLEATPLLRQELLQEAALDVLKKARAAVVVQEYGATGQQADATRH